MYYEEKIINGILHYRKTPDGLFKPFTAEELSEMLTDVRDHLRRVIQRAGA